LGTRAPLKCSFAARRRISSLSRSSVFLLLVYPLQPNQVDLTLQPAANSSPRAQSKLVHRKKSHRYMHAWRDEKLDIHVQAQWETEYSKFLVEALHGFHPWALECCLRLVQLYHQ